MESSQGFFFVDFLKKLKEHPKCSPREKKEMDGMEELPKNFPSLWPQLLLNHFTFQNPLSYGTAWKSKLPSIYLSAR